MNRILLGLVTFGAVAMSGTIADLLIAPPNQWSWSESCGWLNWGDSPPGSQPIAADTYMSGFVWWEAAGWMNLGDGSPGDGFAYANVDGTDFGVNIDPSTGTLFGLAWQEALGWVNFDTSVLGADRARLDLSALRLRGWAWSESAGWINLDDAVFYVGLKCGADLNGDGFVNGADLAILLAAWGPCSGPPALCAADLDTDGEVGGTVDGGDLAILLASWGSCQ